MQLSSKFNAAEVESKWYSYWQAQGYFNSKPDERPPYTIVIPPPNVTGVLHMGHMLNNTLQDILIRRARMRGFNACWVPGTDHASIATEAKVVAKLKAEGIEKNSLTREAFLDHAWEWTNQYGGVILDQLKKLGCSCDWNRTKFTLDDDMSEAVIKVFVALFEKGLIYKGYRMVHWDPEAQTTLSDEEVIYEEKQGMLYHIAYPIEGSEEKVIIATTRPETLLGDTALCIHPDDQRYIKLHGKQVIVPIVDRTVPIITDAYVDQEFGTGCLKVTPAHDPNDYSLGKKHDLEIINIFNDDASINSNGLHYEGKDRVIARKLIVKELEEKGLLIKKEPHTHKVGTSERTKVAIEPRLSDQWFLKMETLAEPAIKAVLKDESISLVPEKFKNTYRHWMENIRDWNISRQLWWGHQIPAYYYGSGEEDFVVAQNLDEALEKARKKTANEKLSAASLTREKDVLDTWFSSWLWPISVFDGIRNPNNHEITYYYPTQDLVTGPDILFFWVARMIISGYEFRGEMPFSKIYLTGLVRDKKGRKMSKQLGNSPDALHLIETFGADAVRVGLMLSAPAGNDLLFDESLCQQGKNFANKIWNAFRLLEGWELNENSSAEAAAEDALDWYENQFQQTLAQVDDHFEKYRISDALMAVYKLIWDDFCSWLLELVKPEYGQPLNSSIGQKVKKLFENNLCLLHPFMPFLSEELWHAIASRNNKEALIVSQWPISTPYDKKKLAAFDTAKEIIGGIRHFRKEKQIPFKKAISLHSSTKLEEIPYQDSIIKLAFISEILGPETSAKEDGGSFRVKQLEFFVPLTQKVNTEEEKEKLEAELKYAKGFLESVKKKLNNERFVNNAPEQVIAIERKKASDAQSKIELLEKSLKTL